MTTQTDFFEILPENERPSSGVQVTTYRTESGRWVSEIENGWWRAERDDREKSIKAVMKLYDAERLKPHE